MILSDSPIIWLDPLAGTTGGGTTSISCPTQTDVTESIKSVCSTYISTYTQTPSIDYLGHGASPRQICCASKSLCNQNYSNVYAPTVASVDYWGVGEWPKPDQ
jgi:hypothetical protein